MRFRNAGTRDRRMVTKPLTMIKETLPHGFFWHPKAIEFLMLQWGALRHDWGSAAEGDPEEDLKANALVARP